MKSRMTSGAALAKSVCQGVSIVMLMVGAESASAQSTGCWLPGESLPGIDGVVNESCPWDPDGAGPVPELMLIGGGFTTAGTHVTSGIVAWDGQDWMIFGEGLPGQVRALTIYEGAPVASVMAHTGSTWTYYVARWDGQQWQQMGSAFDEVIEALVVYDGQLLASGWFTQVGATQARGLAKWDGAGWTEFGGGVAPQSPGHLTPVQALHVHDGSLFVGGAFGFAGGVPAKNIARWDGSSWHALGSGANDSIRGMTSHAGQLAVAGSFSTVGGTPASGIALWDGAVWTSPGGGVVGVNPSMHCLASFQGELYAGGLIGNNLQGLRHFVKWNGSAWESPGGGTNLDVITLATTDDSLYVGGIFTTAGDTGSNGVSRWDGTSWLPFNDGINDHVYTVEEFESEIIIGGRFSQAGDAAALNVARHVGDHWESMGGGTDGTVFDFQEFRGDLIMCGFFLNAGGSQVKNIARWNGQNWESLAGGVNQYGIAYAMTVYHGDLIVCGQFTNAGGVSAQRIARWDGEQWHPMGMGANAFPGFPVAMTIYRGKLIAGGALGVGNGVPTVAEWNGQRWQKYEGLAQPGYYSEVKALAVYQGDLIAAGDFIRPVGTAGRDIARWDGHQWHSMGTGAGQGLGLGGSIWSLAVAGGKLIAGGLFVDMDNLAANSIAQWDGETWSAMGGGVRGGYPLIRQLTRIDQTLYAAGGFTIADEHVSAYLARWQIGGSCQADIAPEEPDGEINLEDLFAVILDWGCTDRSQACAGDIDKSGGVDVHDLIAVILSWGVCQ